MWEQGKRETFPDKGGEPNVSLKVLVVDEIGNFN